MALIARLAIWMLFCLVAVGAPAQDAPLSQDAGLSAEARQESSEEDSEEDAEADGKEDLDEDDDDTVDIETETTVDYAISEDGWKLDGDFRPIVDYFDVEAFNSVNLEENGRAGFRARFLADYGLTDNLHVGARVAGVCFTNDCDLDFVMEKSAPQGNGLKGGQFTFDELYLHWFRTERGSLAFGRLQTRFVLRGGVYAKSLDRNNSNNVNVNWTDGMQAIYRAENGWRSSFVWERNASDGASSIRWGPLDFDTSKARNTYFAGFENVRRWGPIVQRAFDISYLPESLLKDGAVNGRREDYWGLVGRLAARWPQRNEGIRFRAGMELGYAPETQTATAANLAKEADGLAWDIVASIMDFSPGHSIGVNYAQTGAGWLLSPQFRPNEELFEIRYQWRPDRLPFISNLPLIEIRVRWREQLEQPIGALEKASEFDFYARLTWDFTVKDRN